MSVRASKRKYYKYLPTVLKALADKLSKNEVSYSILDPTTNPAIRFNCKFFKLIVTVDGSSLVVRRRNSNTHPGWFRDMSDPAFDPNDAIQYLTDIGVNAKKLEKLNWIWIKP